MDQARVLVNDIAKSQLLKLRVRMRLLLNTRRKSRSLSTCSVYINVRMRVFPLIPGPCISRDLLPRTVICPTHKLLGLLES